MKKFYLSIFFVVFVLQVFAQQFFTVKGKVHSDNGVPLSHVTLKIEGTPFVAITDANGNYSFSQLKGGRYTLIVSSIEIKPKKLTLHVTKDQPDLHIHMDAKGHMALDEVLVERTSVKKEIETSGFAVNVI